MSLFYIRKIKRFNWIICVLSFFISLHVSLPYPHSQSEIVLNYKLLITNKYVLYVLLKHKSSVYVDNFF